MRRQLSFRRFFRADGGNIAISAAASLTVLIGAAALGVDYGALTLQQRRAQTMVDLAAIQAASAITDPIEAVRRYLDANGLDYAIKLPDGNYLLPDGHEISEDKLAEETDTVIEITSGIYRPDPALAVGERFAAVSASPDAVRVTARQEAELYFASSFTDPIAFEVTGTASATKNASYWIGSRLASLNGGILNSVLGGLLGTELSLSVADYNALADLDVDLLAFSEALATELDLTAVTFDDLLATDISYPQFLSALALTRGVPQRASGVLRAVETALGTAAATLRLGDILALDAIGNETIGSRQSLAVYGNALQLVSAAAAVANGERQVDLDLGVSLPGLADVSAMLAIGEPAVSSPVIAAGGAPVRTAQVRLLLDVEAAGLLSLLNARIHLPVFIEVAQSEARLKAITCHGLGTNASVELAVTPGLARVGLGEVDVSKFDDFNAELDLAEAEIVKIPLVEVRGIADVEVDNLTATSVNFSVNDIHERRVKTASTRDIVGSLAGSLMSNVALEVELAGLSLGTPDALLELVGKTLEELAAPLDTVLYNTLLALGVRVGEIDVGVTGVHCGAPVLVQ